VSIQLTVGPLIRPYAGYAAPGLPDGFWAVHASVLGDATGGLQSINIRFSASVQPSVSALWNLEQLIASHSNPSNSTIRIDFGNMDIFPVGSSTGALTKQAGAILNALPVFTATEALRINQLIDKPIFLGAAGKAVNGDIAFDMDNVDATSFSIFAQGYFWGPGALNAEGGPQRPPNSLYGS